MTGPKEFVGGAWLVSARVALATVVLSCLVLSCSDRPVTRSGGEVVERVLVGGSYFSTGYPSGDTLERLGIELASVGSGLTLGQPPPSPWRSTDGGSEVLERVRSGELDLAVVPTRVFDLVGVTSLQGLQAPFVFTSVAQADAVLADPLTEQMLASVEPLGIIGLALTYDALRSVIGYQGPLVEPADFAGEQIAFRPSAVTRSVIAALGAAESTLVGGPFEEAIADRSVAGLEDSINQPNFQAVGWAVGNEFLGLKANAVVVNSEVWAGLDAGQQEALREAAVRTAVWSRTDMELHRDLGEASTLFCSSGAGDVVVATDAQVAAMRAAVAPVLEGLRADPLTAQVIDRAGDIDASLVDADRAVACTNAVAPVVAWEPVAARGDQSVLDGTWRINVTAERLLAAGVSPSDASNNEAAWTFTVDGASVRAQATNGSDCRAQLTLAEPLVTLQWDESTGCGGDFTSRFRLSGDRLEMTDSSGPDPALSAFNDAFFAPGLRRVKS